MSFGNAIYAMSNVNAVLGSINSSIQAKKDGATIEEAISNFGTGVMFGAMRNAVAKDIYDRTGSSLGYTVNTLAGYGNPQADAQGTSGLFTVSMLTSPFGLFGGGCHHRSYMMPSTLYGGFWGGSFFAGPGGCCHHPKPFFGGPTVFGRGGFFC